MEGEVKVEEQTPEAFPLISINAQWHMCVHSCTHAHTLINNNSISSNNNNNIIDSESIKP